ncbi:MAG: hypothetical protein BVN32_00860 [Proteobacteria bacterium ST_bin14]|nr:MAG: hypothetical protein BVN32_00860 [Proteobacteria bacterium ST_bin14]
MTDDLLPETPMTAAELVLGLLEGDERAAALRRMLTDPHFAAEVESWRDHFGVLFDAVPEIAAPEGGLARIEASIDAKGNRLPGPALRAANDDGPVRFWRALAVASSIAATFLLAITLFAPARVAPGINGPQIARAGSPSLPGALLVAQIQPVKGTAPVAAVFDPATGSLRVSAAALVDARHSPELWVIPAGGTPHSLGVLHARQPTAVAIRTDDRARFAAGGTLAVTIEPIGGSPSGKPTGAVIAQGALTLI